MATSHNLAIALVDAAVWAVWSSVCGYAAHRIPSSRLTRDRGILRLTRAEAGGRPYERVLRIKRWKDLLPEAGNLFRGGFSKRRVLRHDRAYLEEFTVATRRAEIAHWPILALGPVFFAWNPWWLGLVMVAYAIAANVPCILVQRYNRARLLHMLGAERRI